MSIVKFKTNKVQSETADIASGAAATMAKSTNNFVWRPTGNHTWTQVRRQFHTQNKDLVTRCYM